MRQIAPVNQFLLGIVLGCLGSAIVYGILLPKVRAWFSGRPGDLPPRERPAPRSSAASLGAFRRTIRQALSSSELVAGALVVLLFAGIAVAAPVIAPPQDAEDPYIIPRTGIAGGPEPPGEGHLLGRMEGQYDVFYGVVWGTRVAFRIGLTITIGRALVGVVVGLIAGYQGGWLDELVMRITDAFLAFPVLAAVMMLLAVSVSNQWDILLGKGEATIVLALILFGWMQYARLVRGNVLVEREKDYVKAAISIGARDRRVILRHLLPNAAQGLFVLIASDIGAMMVTVAALTFIGLSGDQVRADWGMMLKAARNWIVGGPSNAFQYWYTYTPPIVAILLFSMGWSLIGDGLRQALDPRMRGVHR